MGMNYQVNNNGTEIICSDTPYQKIKRMIRKREKNVNNSNDNILLSMKTLLFEMMILSDKYLTARNQSRQENKEVLIYETIVDSFAEDGETIVQNKEIVFALPNGKFKIIYTKL